MNVEEILLKLGIRMDSFQQGIEKSKAEVTKLGEHLKKNFMPKEGEGLVGLLDQLASKFPMVADAAKIALNPISVALGAAFGAFAWATSKLDEYEAKLDKLGDAAAQSPLGNVKENKFKVRGATAAENQEFEWWREDLNKGKPGEREAAAMRRRLEQARIDAKGDPVKEAQARLQILNEEKAKAEAQTKDAESRAATLQAQKTDPKVRLDVVNRETERANLLKQREEKEKQRAEIDAKLEPLERKKAAGGGFSEGSFDLAMNALKVERERISRELGDVSGPLAGGIIGRLEGFTRVEGADEHRQELEDLIQLRQRYTKEIAATGPAIEALEKKQQQGGGAPYEQQQIEEKIAALKAGRERMAADIATSQSRVDWLTTHTGAKITTAKGLNEAVLENANKGREIQHNLGETQSEAETAKTRAIATEQAIAAEKKALFDAERKRQDDETAKAIESAEKRAGANKLAFLTEKIAIEEKAKAAALARKDEEGARLISKQIGVDAEALEVERINKQKAQEKLDRDIKYSREKRQDAVNESYLSTVRELAGMAEYDPYRERQAAMQRSWDMGQIGRGSSYSAKYAEKARELEITDEEAKRALLVEGPASDRFKQLAARSQSLQKDLADAGLIKHNTSLEKIDKNIADLTEQARKEGLIVQPVNGP